MACCCEGDGVRLKWGPVNTSAVCSPATLPFALCDSVPPTSPAVVLDRRFRLTPEIQFVADPNSALVSSKRRTIRGCLGLVCNGVPIG